MREALSLYGAGLGPAAIAAELGVAATTARHLLEASRERTGQSSTRAAVDEGIRRGEL